MLCLLLPDTISAAKGQQAVKQTQTIPVMIRVDAAKPQGPLTPIWRYFGYDEANYTYGKDGKKLLAELGKLGGPQVYIRCHHLLTSGDGTSSLKWSSTGAYREDAQGNPLYDWTLDDRIFDTYLARGLKPYVQIGFMPKDLSSRPDLYPSPAAPSYASLFAGNRMIPFDAGQAYPPKDYAKWGELAYQWTKHCVERYGKREVESWYWEVWNEPNIGYWKGSREEYFKLYDFAAAGVRRALPTARVGGPETAGGAGGTFLHDFLQHCAHGTNFVTGQQGSPLDFIAFHAKGRPEFLEGHVRMGMSYQLNDIDNGFAAVAEFPEYRKTPVIIGESDPEGCAACKGPQNGYRNGTMYSSYTAASFPRKLLLAEKHGVHFEGALTWAFEFENQPYFAGFRALATNGVDLPVLNVFRMFGIMAGKTKTSVQRVEAVSTLDTGVETIRKQGVRTSPDIAALAAREGTRLTVMVWHYHDDDLPGPEAQVSLELNGFAAQGGSERENERGSITVTRYLIDGDHSNSYTAWQRMGSPEQPTAEQARMLAQAGRLAKVDEGAALRFQNGAATVRFSLARQGVTLIVVERK